MNLGTGFSDFKPIRDLPNNSMGFKKTNVMLEAKDPFKSVVSLDSQALQRIHDRNADRLMKLDEQDEVGSMFEKLSVASLKPKVVVMKQEVPARLQDHRHELEEIDDMLANILRNN